MKFDTTFITILGVVGSLGFAQAGTSAGSAKAVCTVADSACDSDYFDYDFVDVLYRHTDFSGHGIDDGSGAVLGLSKRLGDCHYLTACAHYGEVNGAYHSSDMWSLSVGGGWIIPLHERVHLLADAGVSYSFFDGGEDDRFGGYAGPVLRIGVSERLEVFTSVIYQFNEDDQHLDYTGGVVFGLTDSIGLVASATYNEDETSIAAGLRFSF